MCFECGHGTTSHPLSSKGVIGHIMTSWGLPVQGSRPALRRNARTSSPGTWFSVDRYAFAQRTPFKPNSSSWLQQIHPSEIRHQIQTPPLQPHYVRGLDSLVVPSGVTKRQKVNLAALCSFAPPVRTRHSQVCHSYTRSRLFFATVRMVPATPAQVATLHRVRATNTTFHDRARRVDRSRRTAPRSSCAR